MFAKSLVAATLVSGVYSLTVTSPASLVQCQPVQLRWGEGTAPFYVSIIPGGQPSAAALESFPTTSDTSMTWVVDIASGTEVTVKVVDSTGDTNYSSQVTIQAGSTTECSSSSGAAGAGTASAPAASSSSAAATIATRPASAASSEADDSTSAARSMTTSTRAAASTSGASSSTARSVTSGIGANAAATPSASTSATGAASSIKASSALVGSFVAGAAMLYALA